MFSYLQVCNYYYVQLSRYYSMYTTVSISFTLQTDLLTKRQTDCWDVDMNRRNKQTYFLTKTQGKRETDRCRHEQ